MRDSRALLFSVLLVTAPHAANAANTATTTGIAAGIGLTAASGKTTISSGGVIEAELLNSQAVAEAGNIIAQLAVGVSAKHPGAQVLLLGRNDPLDLTAARWVEKRLNDIIVDEPKASPCANPSIKVPVKQSALEKALMAESSSSGSALIPAPNDIVAALATDTTIQGLSFSTDDRLLVESIMMAAADGSAHWTEFTPGARITVPEHHILFRVPADSVDVPQGSPVISQFDVLQRRVDQVRACTSAQYKAWLSEVNAFETTVLASDKGATPPLFTAAQLLSLSPMNKRSLVLRVFVEQSGGTAITRSNIFYTLGFPGAATVSTGILVSFRMSDTSTGEDVLTGFVRCAVKPTRFREIEPNVGNDLPAGMVKCGVIAS